MDKLISKLVMSHLWKTFQGGMVHEKTYANKAEHIFVGSQFDIFRFQTSL